MQSILICSIDPHVKDTGRSGELANVAKWSIRTPPPISNHRILKQGLPMGDMPININVFYI